MNFIYFYLEHLETQCVVVKVRNYVKDGSLIMLILLVVSFAHSFSKEAHNINVNSLHWLSLCLHVFYFALKHHILVCLLQLEWAWVFWKLPRSSTHRRIFFSWGKKWGTLNHQPAELWAALQTCKRTCHKQHCTCRTCHSCWLFLPGRSKRRA